MIGLRKLKLTCLLKKMKLLILICSGAQSYCLRITNPVIAFQGTMDSSPGLDYIFL